MQQQHGSYQRQMYQVDVQCNKCGTAIHELPFQPDGTRPVYCSNCYTPRNNKFRGGR